MKIFDNNLLDNKIYGHAAIILSQLEHEFATGRFPHAILLSGAKGIGKATIALELATKILTNDGNDKFAERRIKSGSYSDLLIISPAFDEKKEEYAKEITVEQTREIPEFLSLKAGEGAWRIVIINDADIMNHAAANSLLKTLEEPPAKSLLILVAHQSGNMLATIRSRCRTIKISPFSEEDFLLIVREQLLEASHDEIVRLGEITDYSAGLAVELYRQGALDLLDQMQLTFATSLSKESYELPHAQIIEIAEKIVGGNQHRNFQIFTRLALHLINKEAKSQQKYSEYLAKKWQEVAEQLSIVQSRHLDYKSAVISFFNSLNDISKHESKHE